MRAAACYGARLIVVEGSRGHKSLIGCAADTPKTYRHIPTIAVDDLFDAHPAGSIPVAVDLVEDAVSLVDFVHPESAFYLFGPEDGTLGKRHLDRCKHRVFVPTSPCMNLAATVNVVLYDRLAKAMRLARVPK
jgi:tRNA(Leu) C34 or U34 (ribose-2'-O)-methylase TrmL